VVQPQRNLGRASRPWIDYLARSSYLLQQGRFAADLLYFYGEDSNLTAIFSAKAPDVPAGLRLRLRQRRRPHHMFHAANGRITA
jgi:hypothetical protein